MEMEDSQEIEAARKILAGSSAEIGGGFGSKPVENRGLGNEPEENQVKQLISSDLNRDDDSVVKKRVVETELVVETSFEVDDDVHNVSNVNMTGSVNDDAEKETAENHRQSNGTVFDMDKNGGQTGEEEEQEDKMDLDSNKYTFRVGDLVWAKIRSHPWWPGQIYDPSDASEFAEKHSYARQGGRLLVAFFGDGSCSWCLPSQLIPFTEHFQEMSTDSSSRSFLNAVHSAVDEVGRLVELDMMCKCIQGEYKHGLCRKLVVNAGIKEGVLVPQVDVGRLSVPIYEPVDVFARVRRIAVDFSVGSMIEFVVLKSCISAFYRWKGGFRLPVYKEPDYIEGLEDKSGIGVESKGINVNMNDFSVPIEVPIGPVGDESAGGPTLGGVDSAGPTNGRKQKSVAELMKDSPEVKAEPKSKRRSLPDSGKSVSAKKRRSDDCGSNGGASSRVKSVLGKRKSEEVSNAATNEVAEEVGKEDQPPENNGFADGETTMVSSPRERKKSKYLSPPYTNLNWREGSSSFKKGSEVRSEKYTEIAHEDDIPLKKLKQQKELDASGNGSETVEDNEKRETGGDAEKRETGGDAEKRETGGDAEKRETGRDAEKRETGGDAEKRETGEDAEKRETYEDNEDIVFTSAVDVSVKDMLSEIQFAAVDHVDFSKTRSVVAVLEFCSAFRSLIHLQGSNYNMFHKCQQGRKKKSKSLLSEPDNGGNGLTPTKSKSSGPKLTSLILTFPPESTLPSMDDIIQLFSRFGSLNEAETCVMPDSYSAKVVYTNDVAAKEAFKSSVNESLFGDQIVNYKLQHSSTESRSRGSQTRISSQRTPKKKTASSKLVANVAGIRQKLETMEAMLENCSNKISTKDKSSLKEELKSLSEKVETAVEKVKKVVENKSSS